MPISVKHLNPIYKKHKRTSQIVALNNQQPHSQASSNQFIDFNISNVVLANTNDKFSYYCKLFKVSEKVKRKRHISKWQLLQAESHFNRRDINIKKVLVYECSSDYDGEPKIHSGDCHNSIKKTKYCHAASIGWWFHGTGEAEHYLPTNAGYPIGGDTDYKYILIEVYHQSNFKRHNQYHNKPGIFSP